MRGICGWLGCSGRTTDPAKVLDGMARVFGYEVGTPNAEAGAAALGTGPRARARRIGDLVVALAGEPQLREGPESPELLPAIAALYRNRPERLPAALRGPFALAILEPAADRALLAVDRIGIEALSYALTGDGLVFASRADSVAAHPDASSELDPQGVYDYLYFECVPSPRVIFRGQHKLLPGQCIRYAAGRVESSFYWGMEYQEQPAPFEPLKREFLAVLEQSVRRGAEGTDPERTGCFLSGGTDSSTVSGLLTRIGGRPAQTYSIGFASEGYDEMSFARIAERHFGLDSHHYYVTPEDVLEAIPRIAAAYDEPFGNASAVPTLFCAELAARDGVDTLLAGDGGDEIFGGNARYAHQLMFELYDRVPVTLRSALLEPLAFSLPGAQRIMPLRKLGSYIRQYRVPLPDRMQSYNFLHRTPPGEIFSADFLATVDTREPLENLREVYHRADCDSPLNRMLHLDMKITLADNDLRKVSRMCELAGVEVRYPMLDEAFVELSGRVPPQLKIKRFKLRWFFKQALRELLPQEILRKRKHGFGLPVGPWLRDHPGLSAHSRRRLEELKKRSIVRGDYIDSLLYRHGQVHPHYYGVMVWILMMLEEWLQTHRL